MNEERENWFLLDSGNCEPQENMLIDKILLEKSAVIGRPLLRLYGWKIPAGSYGFFQNETEIEKITTIRPLVKRPTGGGFVPHINDWTYSLVFPPNHYWHRLKAVNSYQRLHQWICEAFKLLGIETKLAPESVKPLPGQCFIGYEKYDLLQNGKKIAGAAQRRTKTGMLIQGSIQPIPKAVSFSDWKSALVKSASTFLNATFSDFVPNNYEFFKNSANS